LGAGVEAKENVAVNRTTAANLNAVLGRKFIPWFLAAKLLAPTIISQSAIQRQFRWCK